MKSVEGLAGGLIDVCGVVRLAEVFSTIDLSGEGPPPPPWGKMPSAESFRAALKAGRDRLPAIYHSAYIEHLESRLMVLAEWSRKAGGGLPGETLLGAVYQHSPDSLVSSPLRRLIAVIGHFYETFMGDEKRRLLGLPMIESLPPLATFCHSGTQGPFTFTARIVKLMVGAEVDIVSLPSTYREHPVIWASLSHETGGHVVLHSVTGLLEELGEGVWQLVADQASSLGSEAALNLAHLWRFWIDETAADVLGLLNLGPSYAFNLSSWLSALRAESDLVQVPQVLTSTLVGPDAMLDKHPTDILRIHLAYGVTEKLHGLDSERRRQYLKALEELSAVVAGGATELRAQGILKLPTRAEIDMDLTVPLSVAQETAVLVGNYMADTPFRALNGHTLQFIETWDDADEALACRVADAIEKTGRAEMTGGASHLLAGATLALIAKPDSYEKVTQAVNDRLDECLRLDSWTAEVSM